MVVVEVHPRNAVASKQLSTESKHHTSHTKQKELDILEAVTCGNIYILEAMTSSHTLMLGVTSRLNRTAMDFYGPVKGTKAQVSLESSGKKPGNRKKAVCPPPKIKHCLVLNQSPSRKL